MFNYDSKREFKGRAFERFTSDYTVIDLETTGKNNLSAEIIEIGAIKIRDNKVVDEFASLVFPKCHIPSEATAINHISDDMVLGAPVVEEIIDDFLSFVGDDIVVGYNNAGFDMNIIYDKCINFRKKPFRNDYIDVYHAVSRTLKQLKDKKLETACRYYNLDIEGEHRALKDCYLTKSVYEQLYKEYGDEAFKKSDSCKRGNKYTTETLLNRELSNIIKHVLEDGIVSEEEAYSIWFWAEEHSELSGHYPYDRVFDTMCNILEDGVVSKEELNTLKEVLEEVNDPVNVYKENIKDDNLLSLFAEKRICLTGEFDYGDKEDVEKVILSVGGILEKTVTKKTDIVLVGNKGSIAWKNDTYGTKVQKAIEYNNSGCSIKIIREEQIISSLGNKDDLTEIQTEYSENSFSDSNWQESVKEMLNQIIKAEELPNNSLYLMANYGRVLEGYITSYSVCIYEPNYPEDGVLRDATRNSIILNIKENKSKLEMIISNTRYEAIGGIEGAIEKRIASDSGNVHLLVDNNSELIVPYLKKLTLFALKHYSSKASSFGCCSSFVECSDAKKCIHENKLYAKACMYRQNLEANRIFYGKNKNV